MKERIWYYRLGVKIGAVFAALCLLAAGTLLVGASVLAMRCGGTHGTVESAQRRVAEYFLKTYDWQIARDYAVSDTVDAAYAEMPFSVVIQDADGMVLLSNYDGGTYLVSTSDSYWYVEVPGRETYITATLFCPPVDRLTGDSWLEVAVRAVTRWHTHRGLYMAGGAACWLGALACCIYLCCAAGRRPDGGDPRAEGIHRIPFDLFTAGCAAAAYLPAAIYLDYGADAAVSGIIGITLLAVWELLLFGGFFLSLAVTSRPAPCGATRWWGMFCGGCGRALPPCCAICP